MLRAARGALFAVLPLEIVLLVLGVSGVAPPRPVVVAGAVVVAAVLLLEITVVGRLVRERRRAGGTWGRALLGAGALMPEPVRRLMWFELKGLAGLALCVARRRHGVAPGAVPVPYTGGQLPMLAVLLFAMVVEVVCVELLLRGLGAPTGVHVAIVVVELYSILVVLEIMAACVTRPHVLAADELRVRYGVFLDARVPRERIASVRLVRAFDESGAVSVADETLVVAVSSQTNVVARLREPVTVVRPMGRRAGVRTIRFFADDPHAVLDAMPGPSSAAAAEPGGRRASAGAA